MFPFTENHASIKYSFEELEIGSSYKRFETEVKAHVDFSKYDVFYNSDPYFSYSLGFNLMDGKQNIPLSVDGLNNLSNSKNAVVIWESWYSPVEDNCSLTTLINNKDLIKIFELKNIDSTTSIAIFEFKK